MLTVREVAKRLKVSATCVYQLIEKGSIACHRIGTGRGTIRIGESDLSAFLDDCREERSERRQTSPRSDQKLKHLKY